MKGALFLSSLFLCLRLYTQSAGQDVVIFKGKDINTGKEATLGKENLASHCYFWIPATGLSDPHIANPVATPAQTTEYTLVITDKNTMEIIATDKVNVYVLKGIDISAPTDRVCDGKSLQLDLIPDPLDIPSPLISKLVKTVVMQSKAATTSRGNVVGNTDMKFGRINENFEVRILNGIWYSTQTDNCNDGAPYEITGKFMVNGEEIHTNTFAIDVVIRGCYPDNIEYDTKNPFAGDIDFFSKTLPNGQYEAIIRQGNFRKNLIAINANITVPPTSQFYDMIIAEEAYHVDQIEGRKGTAFADLFDVNRILKNTNLMGPFIGNTELEAGTKAVDAFVKAKFDEIERSRKIIDDPKWRCDAEREAKKAVNSTYAFTLKCSYPGCN